MGIKLEKPIKCLYAAGLLLIIAIFIYMCFNIKNTVTSSRSDSGYVKLDAGEFITNEHSDAPVGAYNVCLFTLPEISQGGTSLVFFTAHESVEVYIGGTLIYSLHPDENNLFSKTSGGHWNSIPLYYADSQKSLRIVLYPLYSNLIDTYPDFYVGSKFDICLDLLSASLPTILLAAAAVVTGIIFIVFSLIYYRHSDATKGLLMLGIFSVIIGLWKDADLEVTSLLFGSSIALTYVTYMSLLAVVVPFVMYVKDMFDDSNSILWYIPCIANVILIPVVCILQLLNIADMREFLWLTHVLMLSVVLIFAVMIHRELTSVGCSRKLGTTLFCLGLCLIGLLGDLIVYYTSSGVKNTVLAMTAFLVYVIVLGISSLRHARQLIQIGSNARHLEEMAYHDQLTGLYNRAAYAKYIGSKDFNPEGHIVVMFDLNDLKACNDTMGHDQGDLYIITSARIIKESFSECGTCYRMGGDEFCALLHNVPVSQCVECINRLNAELNVWNEDNDKPFPIDIACGYQLYDPKEDYDIGDTLRRADKMMYTAKYAMKHSKPRSESNLTRL